MSNKNKNKENQESTERIFKVSVDGKYEDVLVTIAYYDATKFEFPTFICTDVQGDYIDEILHRIMMQLSSITPMMEILFNKDENINSTYPIYLNVDGLTTRSVEDEANKILKGTGLKACVIETSEAYYADEDEDPHADLYDGLSMYEAYIEDENEEQVSETTGRYCDLSSVKDELIGFAEECIDKMTGNKEDEEITCYSFCPHCLEQHPYNTDTYECYGCGGVIPDGVIELEESSKKHYTESQHLQKAFAGLGYSKDDIKNIIEAQPVMYIQPENESKIEGEPDIVRYYAVGQVKDGLFTGLIHGYEGGGEYSDHCMVDGKYMPCMTDDEHVSDDDLESMLDMHTDSSFLERCHRSLHHHITYSEDGYFFEINDREKFDTFVPDDFAKPDYANTTFGNEAGSWSNEEYLVQKCNIKELAKQAVAQHYLENPELSDSTLVEEAMRSLRDDIVYGVFFTEKMEEQLREYLDKIFSEMEKRSLEMNEVCLVDSDICTACGTVLLPDDELYESHKGESLCTSCSVLCEGCDKYYIEDEMTLIEGTDVCEFCSKGVEHVN